MSRNDLYNKKMGVKSERPSKGTTDIENMYLDMEVAKGDITDAELMVEDWEHHKDYLANRNFYRALQQYEDYYNDKQENYMPKGIPHVIVNVVKMIIDNKVSTICDSPIQITYVSNTSEYDTYEMQRFSDYTLKVLNFERILKSCAKWALVRGTSAIHVFWNEDAIGKDGLIRGSMEIEQLDIKDIAVANPHEKNVQKQAWIIVHSRESVQRLREYVDKKDWENLVPDDNSSDDKEVDIKKTNLCSVFTRYYRINGEVYFTKTTRTLTICKDVPLNPDISLKKIKESRKADPTTLHSPESTLENNGYGDEMKFNSYPIAIEVLDEEPHDYLGHSDIDGMILGQNAINLIFSLSAQNAIDLQAKYVVKEGALKNQEITNEIGQVLTDYYKGNGDGIKQITGQATMTNQMMQMPATLLEILRKVKNSSDVLSGDTTRDLSGTAIGLLQSSAERPVEAQERQHQMFAEDCARIFLQFYKFYYEDSTYAFDLSNVQRSEMAKKLDPDGTMGITKDTIQPRQIGKFNGEKYKQNPFEITVEAGAGGRFSQINEYSFVNQLVQMMPNMSPTQLKFLVQMVPDYMIKNKAKMLDFIEAQSQDENEMLKKQIQEMAQMMQMYKSSTNQLNNIIKYYKNYSDELVKQSSNSIKTRDLAIQQLQNNRGVGSTEEDTASATVGAGK